MTEISGDLKNATWRVPKTGIAGFLSSLSRFGMSLDGLPQPDPEGNGLLVKINKPASEEKYQEFSSQVRSKKG